MSEERQTEFMRESDRSPTLEMFGGWLGFLGLGFMREGRIGEGIVLLLLWWLLAFLIIQTMFIWFIGSAGYGICCVGIVYIAGPIFSARWLKREIEAAARQQKNDSSGDDARNSNL